MLPWFDDLGLLANALADSHLRRTCLHSCSAFGKNPHTELYASGASLLRRYLVLTWRVLGSIECARI